MQGGFNQRVLQVEYYLHHKSTDKWSSSASIIIEEGTTGGVEESDMASLDLVVEVWKGFSCTIP